MRPGIGQGSGATRTCSDCTSIFSVYTVNEPCNASFFMQQDKLCNFQIIVRLKVHDKQTWIFHTIQIMIALRGGQFPSQKEIT